MPPSTHRLSNGGVVRVWRGLLTGDGQLAGAREFLTLENARELQYAIVDYRHVTGHTLRPADAQRLADLNRRLGPIRVVAIAPQDVVFGFGRMVELTRGEDAQWQLFVARTVDDAIAWLERELPHLDFAEARETLETVQ